MRDRRNRRRDRFSGEEDVNPMNSVSNLADVMLVFAVGLMLALVAYWNLDVTPEGINDVQSRQESLYDIENAQTFSEEEREKMQSGAKEGGAQDGMEKTGEIYYDPDTQTYYIVEIKK